MSPLKCRGIASPHVNNEVNDGSFIESSAMNKVRASFNTPQPTFDTP
jgi:hypothetical protein